MVIAGPTASGKSAIAARLAERLDAVVINADSMQVYQGVGILTAQPPAALQARQPHRLYGIMAPWQSCSAGAWRGLATEACREAWQDNRLPVLVGGSGLYIRSLLQGLSPIPDIPAPLRDESRALLVSLGNQEFHRRLALRDPVMAARLDPGNSQRLVRAWEVLAATGKSLADWQAEPRLGGVPAHCCTVILAPPRDSLYASCDDRLAAMVRQGALDEVAGLLALGLAPGQPVMKALGVAQLADYLQGSLDLDAALALARQATRNYAKRQSTWFRHQLIPQMRLEEKFSESLVDKIFSFIRQFLLTGAV